jgi:hypothetical protein
VPLRIANFAGLRLDQHLLRREDKRGERPWVIHVPAAMVKNAVDLDYELPAPIARDLELYLERFRSRLVAGTNPWPFPSRDGEAKHTEHSCHGPSHTDRRSCAQSGPAMRRLR